MFVGSAEILVNYPEGQVWQTMYYKPAVYMPGMPPIAEPWSKIEKGKKFKTKQEAIDFVKDNHRSLHIRNICAVEV